MESRIDSSGYEQDSGVDEHDMALQMLGDELERSGKLKSHDDRFYGLDDHDIGLQLHGDELFRNQSQRSTKLEKQSDHDLSIGERLDRLAEDIKKLSPERIGELEKIVQSMSKRVVSIKEASEILGVSQDTIRRAIKSGNFKAFQLNKMGNWKIPMDQIDQLLSR